MIGIPAYNEEHNIGSLLEKLIKEYPSYDILVISSGSDDNTNNIIQEYCNNHRNVKIIIEKERSGKSSALALLLRELNNSKYDAMVYLGADNLPEKGAINKLLDKLFSSDDIGMVGGHPIPLNNPNTFCGWIAHIIWNVHHQVSLKNPKISGELCAIKSGIVYDIPPTIINDDAYLQIVTLMRKYRVEYVPDAIVYLRAPETISDFIKQRYRITIGHYQIEQLLGAKLPTTYAKRNILIAWKHRVKTNPIKDIVWFTSFLLLSAFIVLKAWINFHIRRKLPYIWDMAKSTKKVLK